MKFANNSHFANLEGQNIEVIKKSMKKFFWNQIQTPYLKWDTKLSMNFQNYWDFAVISQNKKASFKFYLGTILKVFRQIFWA